MVLGGETAPLARGIVPGRDGAGADAEPILLGVGADGVALERLLLLRLVLLEEAAARGAREGVGVGRAVVHGVPQIIEHPHRNLGQRRGSVPGISAHELGGQDDLVPVPPGRSPPAVHLDGGAGVGADGIRVVGASCDLPPLLARLTIGVLDVKGFRGGVNQVVAPTGPVPQGTNADDVPYFVQEYLPQNAVPHHVIHVGRIELHFARNGHVAGSSVKGDRPFGSGGPQYAPLAVDLWILGADVHVVDSVGGVVALVGRVHVDDADGAG
mmetsp:Transcript_30762/g.92159  ORF Transcript_30762/g.92159 Transcript_30762/m.92159 type:complete len:269 (+) Transcript_30762:549-1355(+)